MYVYANLLFRVVICRLFLRTALSFRMLLSIILVISVNYSSHIVIIAVSNKEAK